MNPLHYKWFRCTFGNNTTGEGVYLNGTIPPKVTVSSTNIEYIYNDVINKYSIYGKNINIDGMLSFDISDYNIQDFYFTCKCGTHNTDYFGCWGALVCFMMESGDKYYLGNYFTTGTQQDRVAFLKNGNTIYSHTSEFAVKCLENVVFKYKDGTISTSYGNIKWFDDYNIGSKEKVSSIIFNNFGDTMWNRYDDIFFIDNPDIHEPYFYEREFIPYVTYEDSISQISAKVDT